MLIYRIYWLCLEHNKISYKKIKEKCYIQWKDSSRKLIVYKKEVKIEK
jgi:hypothetical protein